MAYDETRDAARQLQGDAQAGADDVRTDLRAFVDAALARLGVVGDDAKRLAGDLTGYLQHWGRLVREDTVRDAKVAGANLGLGLAGGFLAAVGFILLNVGIIWELSSTDTGVGPWYIIFGCGWIVVGAILGATAYFAGKKAVEGTVGRMKNDVEIPQRHARAVYQRIQEIRHEPPTTH